MSFPNGRNRAPDAGLIAWLATIDEERPHLSVTTIAELRFGVSLLAAGARKRRLDRWGHEDLLDRFTGWIDSQV
jgi:hypothetical protein